MAILKRDRERATEVMDFAASAGLSFEAKDSMGLIAYFRDMKLFKNGGRRRIFNLIQRKGQILENSGMFDYHYTVSTGKSSRTFRQSVYFRIDPEFVLPEFHMFPEKWYHRINKWFGAQDINFAAYPEFSKSFMLQGAQPDFIWRLFQSDRLIIYFDTHRDISIEAVGRYFVMYRNGTLTPVNEMKQWMTAGDKLYALLQKRNTELESKLNSGEDIT